MLCYVDDILVVHHDGMEALRGIDKFFKMKKVSVGDPDYYLGATTLTNAASAYLLELIP